MAEMAWYSFDMPSKIFHFSVRRNKNKIHPTQKPIELYEWLLRMYAKPTDKVLDTHLGSGTIAVACYKTGIDLTACEISKMYYEKSIALLQEYIPMTDIFVYEEPASVEISLGKNRSNNLQKPYSQSNIQLQLAMEQSF